MLSKVASLYNVNLITEYVFLDIIISLKFDKPRVFRFHLVHFHNYIFECMINICSKCINFWGMFFFNLQSFMYVQKVVKYATGWFIKMTLTLLNDFPYMTPYLCIINICRNFHQIKNKLVYTSIKKLFTLIFG